MLGTIVSNTPVKLYKGAESVLVPGLAGHSYKSHRRGATALVRRGPLNTL